MRLVSQARERKPPYEDWEIHRNKKDQAQIAIPQSRNCLCVNICW